MNLRRVGKYYYVWFSRSERPPKGQLVSLKEVTGFSISDPDEAKEVFNIIKREWHKGKIIELDKGKRLSITELSDAFTQDPDRVDLSPDTHRMDILSLKTLRDIVGDKSVRALTKDDFKKFKQVLRDRGLSPHSINSYRRHILAALNFAIEGNYLNKIPKFKRAKTGSHDPRILKKTEIIRIKEYARKHDPELYRFIVFSLWTGTRRDEILHVKWQNISGTTCQIIGKGNKHRTVKLRQEALDAIGDNKQAIGPVFKQWHKDTISHRFKDICRALGIEDAHFHNLRHSAATYMIESGMHPKAVQRALGHADYRTTEKYIKIHDEFMLKEMEKLKY